MKKIIAEERLGRIFCSLAIVLFGFLFCVSFWETWENPLNLEDELVYVQRDSLLLNLLGLALVIFAGCLIYRLGKLWIRQKQRINMDVVALVACGFSFVFSLWWVSASGTAPQADQLVVCEHAEAFTKGDYSGLEKGGYVGIYRHQLGLITFLRLLFKFFGMGNYQVFQYLNALMIPVLIFSGYQLVKRLSGDSRMAESVYLLLMLTCVPLYCYVPFVYGEVMSTALVVFAAWMLMWCQERFCWWKILLLSSALAAAVQLRRNALIFVIAFSIVAVVGMLSGSGGAGGRLRGFPWQKLTILAAIWAGVLLSQLAINLIYEPYVPEDSLEAPASVYIAMGVNDDDYHAPGWHNDYDHASFRENDYNIEKTNQAAMEYLRSFWDTCKENPGYALDFYYRKICGQWNVPMYQCLAMNNNIVEEQSGFAEQVYFGSLRGYLEKGMNIYHLATFGGVFVLLLIKRKSWQHIENYTVLIAVFGGFLFSVLWEAKPRYVFPYFVAILPYAAVGIYEFVRIINIKIEKYF